MSDAGVRLAGVAARLRAACARAGRPEDAAALVAVSKFHGADAVLPALRTGHLRFAENRVQEAQTKWPALRERYPHVELHLIGSLQSNKAADAVRVFDVVQSVDRPKVATALARAMDREGRRPRCYVQVNTGAEGQKGGIAVGEVAAFVKECRETLDLPVAGLMCIPPAAGDPAPHFRLLRSLAADTGLPGLSMGMSGDFETAVAEGSTLVRVGSAVFGARPAGPAGAAPATELP
ncbi:YggS family pyridoxal phosphate-dependent enzyme [Streptomyces sp. HUAS MG47]|uniref:YggS family pyridoxal phosphate-dependent enzyme n=1 Tax=Streptomyces solicamelliae TaxID=3231716 RepID=UPI00387841BB